MVVWPLDDRMHEFCIHSYEAVAKAVRLLMAALIQKMYYQMCSIDIFVDLKNVLLQFESGTFRSPYWG